MFSFTFMECLSFLLPSRNEAGSPHYRVLGCCFGRQADVDSEPGRGRMQTKTSIGRTELLPQALLVSVLFSFFWCRLEHWVLS